MLLANVVNDIVCGHGVALNIIRNQSALDVLISGDETFMMDIGTSQCTHNDPKGNISCYDLTILVSHDMKRLLLA